MAAALISALLQVGIVLLIGAGTWLALRRPKPFLRFIALTPAPWRSVVLGMVVGAVMAALLTRIPAVQNLSTAERTVVGEATRGGFTAGVVGLLAIRAVLQTSLSEELLFRGLIGHNLIRRLGFATGNSIQAVLFGSAHLLLLLSPKATLGLVLAMVVFTGATGWVMGWVNERFGKGSILPGWGMHGGGNLTAYLLLASGT